MSYSKEHYVIDFVISKLQYGDYLILDQKSLRPDFEFKTDAELNNIYKLAEEYGLIDRKGKRTILWLTKKGYEIQQEGGWIQHLTNKENKQYEDELRQTKSDQILDLDLKLKTFENRLGRKLLFAGFIITVLSFLISLLTSKIISEEGNIPNRTNDTEQKH